MISEELIGIFYPFTKLDKNGLEDLLQLSFAQEVRKDTVIYSEGSPPDFFYFLLKGKVGVFSKTPLGVKEIETIDKGVSFGIISLFTGEPHSVTTKTKEDSTLLKIKCGAFKEFLQKYPFLALDFSLILSKRVKKRVDAPKKIFKSTGVTIMSGIAAERVIEYIIDIAYLLKEEGRRRVCIVEVLDKGRSVLPSFTGSAVSSASLSKMRSAGDFSAHIVSREIDYFSCRLDREGASTEMLFDFLAENYHFIFYCLPQDCAQYGAEAFLGASSFLYYFTAECLKPGDDIDRFVSHMPASQNPFAVGIFVLKNYPGVSSDSYRPTERYPYFMLYPEKNTSYWLMLRKVYRILADKTVGIALSSGGAYGIAHIGALEVIDSCCLPVDMVCGASVGSLVAALWALGFSYDEIRQKTAYFGTILRWHSFLNMAIPLKGMIREKKLLGVCRHIFGSRTFADTRFPLRIVAFNFNKRKAQVFSSGSIYRAVAASCAMPGIFEPVMLGDDYFFDGGVLHALPVEPLVTQGLKKIIAVNLVPRSDEIRELYEKRSPCFNIFDFIFGSIETMQNESVKGSLEVADVVVHPEVSDLNWTEFSRLSDFIARGKAAAWEQKTKMLALTED